MGPRNMPDASGTAAGKTREYAKSNGEGVSSGSPWLRQHHVLAGITAGLTSGVLSAVAIIYANVLPSIKKYLASETKTQVENRVSASLQQPREQIVQMSEDLAAAKGTLQAWAPVMTPEFLLKAAALPDPQFAESVSQLKSVATIAVEAKADAPVEDIAVVGQRLMPLTKGTSASSDVAWEAAQSLVQYRSLLNSLNPPIDLSAAKTVVVKGSRYAVRTEPDATPPSLASTVGNVPGSRAALLSYIGRDSEGIGSGPAMLIARGGNLTLDSLHLKNVVLLGVHVTYGGGLSQLENVYFLNCRFDIARSANGIALSEQILEHPAATLSAS